MDKLNWFGAKSHGGGRCEGMGPWTALVGPQEGARHPPEFARS